MQVQLPSGCNCCKIILLFAWGVSYNLFYSFPRLRCDYELQNTALIDEIGCIRQCCLRLLTGVDSHSRARKTMGIRIPYTKKIASLAVTISALRCCLNWFRSNPSSSCPQWASKSCQWTPITNTFFTNAPLHVLLLLKNWAPTCKPTSLTPAIFLLWFL